ncbi:hypothetical protein WISP_67669 [Willisornis vidua]|uniref:Uncharacterized protein n=1 Tax=Willisornis vidua TaxID=1566151 RepID=A0ABQ9D8E2_9PASS|nr:hypothetical protein WISP_67669 [Willisornis vidua]
MWFRLCLNEKEVRNLLLQMVAFWSRVVVSSCQGSGPRQDPTSGYSSPKTPNIITPQVQGLMTNSFRHQISSKVLYPKKHKHITVEVLVSAFSLSDSPAVSLKSCVPYDSDQQHKAEASIFTEATAMLNKFVLKISSSIWRQKYEPGVLEYEKHIDCLLENKLAIDVSLCREWSSKSDLEFNNAKVVPLDQMLNFTYGSHGIEDGEKKRLKD